jgi:thioredoxin-dependent peroxiredoxin
VIGISRDSIASHDKFKAKFKLPFSLASDEDGKVCQAYGVWVEKSHVWQEIYGHRALDLPHKGFIRNIWRKVKFPSRAEDCSKPLRR